MYLHKLELRDYGPFRSAEWNLPPNGLVLVAGANNAGKSALLSALDVLATPEPQEVRVHARAEGDAELIAWFRLDESDLEHLIGATSKDAEGLRVVIRQGTITSTYLRYRSHMESGMTKLYPAEFGVVTGDGYPVALFDHVWSDEFGDQQLRGRRADPDVGLTDLREIRSGGSNLWQWLASFYNELEPWQVLFTQWRERYVRFAPHRVGTERTRELQAHARLESDGANLPEALAHLQFNEPSAFERVRTVIADIVPDAGRLKLPAKDNVVSAAFEDPAIGLTQNVKDLGTGVEQVVLAAYAGERTEPGSVIVIEEPESHLHPGAQRRLLQHYQQWARDRLIIASTHSTVLLDRSGDLRSHVWLVDRVDGEASLTPATAQMSEVLEAVGVRISDLLVAPRLLVVEGESDETVITTWFGEVLRRMGASVVASDVGSSGARWAARLDDWRSAPDPVAQRVRFLCDRDELDDDRIEKLESSGAVRVLLRRELENYLLVPGRILRFLEEVEPEAAARTSVDAISAAIRRRADELRPIVVAKRAVVPLFSERLVDRKRFGEALASEPPQTAEDAAHLVRSLFPDLHHLVGEMKERWEKAAKEIDHDWDERWQELAPGADLLDAALRTAGRRYDKTRDAGLLAAHHDPPEELAALLREFLA